MFKISTHIYDALKDSTVDLKKIDLIERENIIGLVIKKYIDLKKRGVGLWEKFTHYESLSDDMAWSYIQNFIEDNECIIFFNQEEEKEMFLLKSGNDLNYLLSETYGFEFYITNRKCSYLLCFNHHNILYGCGDAEKWIKEMLTILKN